MPAWKRTVSEVAILGVAGLVLGFSFNELRGSGTIKPFKNYFDKGPISPPPAPRSESGASMGTAREAIQPPTADSVTAEASEHRQHGFGEIKLADLAELLNDPSTRAGLNVFVDARKQDLYDEGHIPGAVRCDPYDTDACIDDVLNSALAADKVVVYCGGGECEDSIFMCRELNAAGVDYGALYLYTGGWSEWTRAGNPVEVISGE